MKIGISCYASIGGSGIVATEIGNALALRGHRVCFIGSDEPWRFDKSRTNPSFHRVEVSDYPVLQHDIYVLALASQMAAVARREDLDLLHVHYAIPHATAAFLCKQILGRDAKIRVVTTLHGTDITLVGNDPSLLDVTRFSVQASDAVTAVSASLAEETRATFGLPELPIEVIPNFVDIQRYAPRGERKAIIVHNSNFRPVKRVEDVIRVFAAVRAPCELVLIGDGPERPRAEALVDALNVRSRVRFLGEQKDFTDVLASATVALFPSERESFGVAILEAMSCGVPPVATRVGGVPDVVRDGGVLCELGDVRAMADAVTKLLTDPVHHAQLAQRARQIAVEVFPRDRVIDRYVALYERVSAGVSSSTA